MLPIFAFGTSTLVVPESPATAIKSPLAFRYVMRELSGDHAIPVGASAVKPGSVKIAETVRGFVWTCGSAAQVHDKRTQKAKKRKWEREGTNKLRQPQCDLGAGKRRVSVQEGERQFESETME